MICLLLIMTIIFINSIESVEQKVRHPDTLLKEEDMSAKTKIWLLMVESGKVDQEELRRITPKSIFIAPLLTSRAGKCKEGYRHDHLGQCVKVIKIDPTAQLEHLLQRLNQLYGGKKETKEELMEEEKKAEETEASDGPLHFSLPISDVNDKTKKENNKTKTETSPENFNLTENLNAQKTTTPSEFIPIPLPMIYRNQTDQIADIESSGAEPLNVTEPIETSEFEGSGDGQVASGDGFQEEKLTTAHPISIIYEETDYFDMNETESITVAENLFTVTPSLEEFPTIRPDELELVPLSESYQNFTNISSVNDISDILTKDKTQVQKEIISRNISDSDKIVFPSDDYNDDDDEHNEGLRTPIKSSSENSRIRFPDEVSHHPLTPSYHSHSDSSSKFNKYQTHSSAIPREQFWWLPKNWQIDENQQKSPLVKVWSRLPLIHDISYSREASNGYEKSGYLEESQTQSANSKNKEKELSISLDHQQTPTENIKSFRSSRFQDIILTPRQNFRLQR